MALISFSLSRRSNSFLIKLIPLAFFLCLSLQLPIVKGRIQLQTLNIIPPNLAKACNNNNECISWIQTDRSKADLDSLQKADLKTIGFLALKKIEQEATNVSITVRMKLLNNSDKLSSDTQQALSDCDDHFIPAIELIDDAVDSTVNAKLVMQYPEMSFEGHVIYSRTIKEVEKSAVELLNFVEEKKRKEGNVALGFDIEWKPSFRRGVPPGKAAVMQICGDKGNCYVLHIIHSGIPQTLQSLLEDPTVVKVGACIANDSYKVRRDHNVSVKALEDLSELANKKLDDPKKWSLASLTEKLLAKQLPKPSNIRLGNWEANVLSRDQLHYAATDAFVSWYLYQALKSLPEIVDNKE